MLCLTVHRRSIYSSTIEGAVSNRALLFFLTLGIENLEKTIDTQQFFVYNSQKFGISSKVT